MDGEQPVPNRTRKRRGLKQAATILLPISAVALGWYLVVPDQQELKATGLGRSRAQIDLQTILESQLLWQPVESLRHLSWELFVRRSFHRGTWVQCSDATGNELLRQGKTPGFEAIEKECGAPPRF